MNWYKIANQYIGYHGTNQDFDLFQIGLKNQDQKGKSSKGGFWFTNLMAEAKQYADYSAQRSVPNQIEHEKKIQEYLKRIQIAERQRNWSLQEKLTEEMETLEYDAINAEPSGQKIIEAILTLNNPYVVDASESNFDPLQTIDIAKANGHDGVIFNNMYDSPKMLSSDVPRTTQYLIFDSKNIKIKNIIKG
jgi:hypothetical protein